MKLSVTYVAKLFTALNVTLWCQLIGIREVAKQKMRHKRVLKPRNSFYHRQMESFLHTVGTSFRHCDRLQTVCCQPRGTSAAEALNFIPDNWLLNNLTGLCRVYVMRSQKATLHKMDLINMGTT